MLVDIYIFFQITLIGLFLTAFFTKQVLLWSINILLSGILMFTAWNIEYPTYVYSAALGAYENVVITNSYPYLMAINMLFFGLGITLMFFDIFDQYGINIISKFKNLTGIFKKGV